MKVRELDLPGVLLIEPEVFGDPRGYFFESYHAQRYRDAGIAAPFVQDNLSRSDAGILRGLHFQNPHTQGKLVQVLDGAAYDVVLDVRAGSPTFGRWVGETLTAENKRQLYAPPGFAHGFCVVQAPVLFTYKVTDFYAPDAEVSVLWNDPDLAIPWPVSAPVLNAKDKAAPRLRDIPAERLPVFAADVGAR
jgi:dTDP-4-dehydrorhamnose 3,5-epimerase